MERNLSDADVDAIVDKLEARAVERLQVNVGKGVIELLGTWLLRAGIMLAFYKAGSSGFLKNLLGF